MTDIPGGMTRKVYYNRAVGHASDKTRRVTSVEYMGRKAAEIRDWVMVPDDFGGPDHERPSSGIIIPLAEVVAIRKALQQIEADANLVDEEAE